VQPVDGPRSDPHHVDDLAVKSAKALLRRAVSLRRDLRSSTQRRADDAARFEVLRRRLSADRRPHLVAAYLSCGSEPGTLQLVAWLAAQRIPVLLPVMTTPEGSVRPDAAWAPYGGPDALKVGVLSILEPTTELAPGDSLARADLIICPALAANTSGDRLGRGGGWYDRALQHAAPDGRLWALLNDDEVLEAIPTRSWDRRVGAIVTPARFIDCRWPPAAGAGDARP
jgi:5-formyltetrahydrofolate cyclo-ligase